MRHLRQMIALVITAALAPITLQAQEAATVTGRVTNAQGQPEAAVLVRIPSLNVGAPTGADGTYRIVIPGARIGTGQTVQLTASRTGLATQSRTVTITPGATLTQNFQLGAQAIILETVTVNAITGQAERPREVGTNVGRIDVAEINKGPITTMAQVLTGRTAGVNVQGVAGTTGTSQRIRIRGANSLSLSNEPLIYVDGALFSNGVGGIAVGGQDFSRLNDLSSEDIATVEVLKGPAAAALYGTAAANGVLLITTKRGRAGAPVWRGYAEAGRISDENEYPTQYLSYEVRDPTAPLVNQFGSLNVGVAGNRPYFPCPNINAASGSCRQDATASFNFLQDPRTTPFQTGGRGKLGVNVSGGNEGVTYYISADRENEDGVISYNTLDKTNARVNLGAQIGRQVSARINMGYTDSRVVLNQNDNNIFSPLINGLLASPFFIEGQDTLRFPGGRPGLGFGYSIGDIGNVLTTQEIDRFIVSAATDYRPFGWLTANANVGLDYYQRFDYETIQPARLPIGSPYTEGYRDSRRNANYIYTANASLVSTQPLGSSLLATTTLGGSFSHSLFESTECFGAGLVPTTFSCASTAGLFSVDEDYFAVKTQGAFVQQELAFRDRLFIAGSLRGDENSAFGADFGFVVYPAANVSWVVSDEPFFQNVPLGNLRLRAAFGTSGLRPDFRDAAELLNPVSVAAPTGDVPGVTLSQPGNPSLRPERTSEFEYGFDVGLPNDRVSLDFTRYRRQSRDALIRRPLPPSFGSGATILDNLGKIRNSGMEIGLNGRVLENPNFSLGFRLQATTVENKILDLGVEEPIVFNRGSQRHEEGFSAGGFFQAPLTFNDADGDGRLTIAEVGIDSASFTGDLGVRYLGPSLPTNTQALSFDLTLFRYIGISTLFERRAGMKQMNYTELFRCNTGYNRQTRGACAAVADPNASLEQQAAFIGSRFLGTNAGWIEDADFVKWRELSLRLGVPTFVSQRARVLDGASVTFSGRNLRTWTDYSGIDPEINESGGGSNFTQGEFNTQPPVRLFTVRFDFQL